MTNANTLTLQFQQAEQAFQRGDLKTAQALLTTIDRLAPNNPPVLHLSAIVARQSGDMAAAARHFAEALRLSPRDSQLCNNFANFCKAQGDNQRALALYDQALALHPKFTDAAFNRALLLIDMGAIQDARAAFAALEPMVKDRATFWTARGRLEREGGNLAQAVVYYDEALRLDPKNARALHGRAMLALERGEQDSLARYTALSTLYPDDAQAKLGLAQTMHELGDPNGVAVLDDLLEQHPTWLDAVLVRAEMRWEAGDGEHYLDDINRALAVRPEDPILLRARIDLMAGVDKFTEAADFARDAQSRQPDFPEFWLLEAVNAGGAGDQVRANEAIAAMRARGWRDALSESRHWLRAGDPEQAESVLAELRQTEPDNIAAWGQTEFTWRLLDDDRSQWLHGQDNLFALRPLGLSDADISLIADYLRYLHNRSVFPVGQSLRGGTQTRGALLWRTEPEAVLLRSAILEAVNAHWNALPPHDKTHPLLRHRDKAPAIRGSWSVRLTDGGFHVSHIHPHGLLSSASYWVVPEPTEGEDPQAGHLEIGRPPRDLNLALEPRAILAPKPGHLALFPSTLMHGTRPFSQGERITMAFDVVAH